jgi:Na+/proline symporter
MLGISLTDWLVIAVYLLGITIIGSLAARRVTSASSLFIGDRKFGKVMMMFFGFGAGTHTDQAVSVAAKTFRVGASGIWYQWLWLFATPFYWLITPVFRRMRAVTTADFFEHRYNRGVALLFALVGCLQLMVSTGVMLKGAGAIVTAVSGGAISPTLAVWGMALMFTTYGIMGGLSAAVITDFIQGILTIILSFLLVPFALEAVNGFDGLRVLIDDDSKFSLVAPTGITGFYIAVIALNGLFGWVAQPGSMPGSAAGKTEMEGRVGFTSGMLIKRVCTVAWVIVGMCAIGLYMGRDIDPDHIYGLMARDLLPTIAPGLIGLFIASLLAGVMSTCDVLMLTSAALFTENVYKTYLAPGRPDRHYILVGRMSSAVVVLLGILFAFTLESVVSGLEIFWKVASMMAVGFWAGLFWRRATAAGVWAGTMAAFGALLFTSELSFFGWTLWDFNASVAPHLPATMVFEDALYLPWQMIIYTVAGIAALIVVSLWTRPESQAKLDRFYECVRTPIQKGGEPETEPFTLPPGVTPAPRNVLVQHPDFEIPRPSALTVGGFLVTWVLVLALVGVVMWIF